MISNTWYDTQASCPHSRLAEEFNPWGGAYLHNPYPFLARARQQQPMLSFRGLKQLLVTWAATNGPQGTEDT